MSFEQIIHSQNWILSSIFILLIIVSIFSWYTIITKAIFFKVENKSLNKFQESQSKNLHTSSTKSIVKAFNLIQSENNIDLLDRKLRLIFEDLKEEISFGQTFLASVANLSPFVGLFGTVLGVYFALIDISKLGNASISNVAAPIGEALIATAIGLWCAIPAAFAFNYYSKMSNSLLKRTKNIVEKKMINFS